jgi:hypothetical protein
MSGERASSDAYPIGSRKSGNFQSADVRPLSPAVADPLASLDQFCRRYPNPKTAEDYRNTLTRLFLHTGRGHPPSSPRPT